MLEKYKSQMRKAVESLYDCTCTIRNYEKYKDPVTKETKTGINPVPKYENEPCRVSKQSLSKNNQTETVNKIVYEVKLFISPEVEINQGDEIEVTNKLGIKEKYKAGEGFPYNSQQEVILNKDGNTYG
jgi:hypothetical protein